jgi:hypothetical protein
MVQVNQFKDKKKKVPLLPGYIHPFSWFEYKGQLYLTIKWEDKLCDRDRKSPGDTKWQLTASVFDETHYTMEAIFSNCQGDIVVYPVKDESVFIQYRVDAEV